MGRLFAAHANVAPLANVGHRSDLEKIQHKIASVEAEIALIEGSGNPEPGLFEKEHMGLQSLRRRLAELREMAKGIEQELRRKP